jgi:transposase-like protein
MCFVCMDVVSLAVLFVIKSRVVKVLDVLDCMFHSSCSRVSRVLSMAVEPISKSAVLPCRRVSEIRISKEPRYKRCIAVDETKLCVKKSYVYVWSAIDADSRELLALETSYGGSSLNTPSFLRAALRMCTNKPLVVLDKGPCIDEH